MNRLYVVGIGPGDRDNMTCSAINALKESSVIVGYKPYIALIADLVEGKQLVSNGMGKEVERCREAVKLTHAGDTVSVVSSGDAGVYGMAGLILEIISREYSADDFDVKIIPGVTAGNSSAAILGAPLMHDYVTISLSDWLTKWETIEKRIHCAGEGDFIVVVYNPKSKKRTDYIHKVQDILLQYKSKDTPVGIVKRAFRDGQQVKLTTLENMPYDDIDMFTTVIIGNKDTFTDGRYMITPRGYSL